MFSSKEDSQEYQIQQWYKYQQQQIEEKFKIMNTDTLQEIRNKMKRRQTKNENDENMELIEQERGRIIESMNEHVKLCMHPSCKGVEEVVLMYNLVNVNDVKKDPVYLIVKNEITIGYVKTACPVGSEINKKMMETHKILKGM